MPISAPDSVVGDQLQPQGGHAGGLGGQLVVADGGEAEPEARTLDRARDADREDASTTIN